eukprot:6477246-Amphidinium_carterae.1
MSVFLQSRCVPLDVSAGHPRVIAGESLASVLLECVQHNFQKGCGVSLSGTCLRWREWQFCRVCGGGAP